jgi:glutaredoxin 3
MTEVKVFSTPTCPYCVKAKDWLKENNVEFKDINVAEDAQARQEMVDKSGQMGVPVIMIDEEIIVGYDVSAMKKALKLEKQ